MIIFLISYSHNVFSKASGLGINAQPLEKLIILGRAVTSDLAHFAQLNKYDLGKRFFGHPSRINDFPCNLTQFCYRTLGVSVTHLLQKFQKMTKLLSVQSKIILYQQKLASFLKYLINNSTILLLLRCNNLISTAGANGFL